MQSYVGDRTHEALETFVEKNVHDDNHLEAASEGTTESGTGEGEGCMVRGVVLVNRVPGNIHLSAHSKHHSFQPHKLNLSHHVNSMSFGKALSAPQLRLLPDDVEEGYNGLANTDHLSIGQNTSLEHYLKVVHTSYEVSSSKTIETFQVSEARGQASRGQASRGQASRCGGLGEGIASSHGSGHYRS